MRKEKNWSRIEYEYAYRQMRRGFSFDDIYAHNEIALGHVKAADYSYQARDYHVHGWKNGLRRKRFAEIRWRIFTKSEVYPF